MAKSKTQRAKASAKRAAKKEALKEQAVETVEATDAKTETKTVKAQDTKANKETTKKETKKKEAPKKQRFQFLKEVRAELKRVTWPTKKDVMQWSGVVVAALLFFGIFVAILDNLVVTPALVGVSSIEIEGVTPQSEQAVSATVSASDSSSSTSTSTEGSQQ